MAMNKHQNNARSGKPYADQPTGHGTGDTRNKLSHGGKVHHGVPGHGSHGHHDGVPGHGSHGHNRGHRHSN